jgi:hypothetical protein
VEFAGDEIGSVVLNCYHVGAGGTGHAIGKDVLWKAFKPTEDFMERLFKIMERA